MSELTDVLLQSYVNFGLLFFESISNVFSLYHLNLDIYVRMLFKRKTLLKYL